MDIELEKLKKLEHALHDAIDILRDWQVEEVKPEENKNWVVYLARQGDEHCYLTACTDAYWKSAQEEYGAKTKLFVGIHDEVKKWYESRQKFAEVIKAWEDGKQLQFRPKDPHLSWQECGNPSWDVDLEYRVKPECPCEDGIDSEACVGCEHSEDGKKKYRPYESRAEMIVDFIDRFKVNCPSYCEPLIWVKGKENDNRFLMTGFSSEVGVCLDRAACISFNTLFNWYTYLDGSPVGMEVNK